MRAIRYELKDERLQASTCELDVSIAGPAAYVVGMDDYGVLEGDAKTMGLVPIVFSDGEDSRESRFRRINRTRRVPYFPEDYQTWGRVEQGMESNLGRIGAKRGRKLFVIAVPRLLFREGLAVVSDMEARRNAARDRVGAGLGAHPEARRAATWLELMGDEIEPEPPGLDSLFRGDSPTCRLVRHLIVRAAKDKDATVLIEGERGTGKELVARAIHEYSERGHQGKPYKTLNCAAISPMLVEAELFGAVEGYPHPHSRRKIGIFEAANGGTLFLDEIGDMPSEHQPKILRAIQEKSILPVGATNEIDVDVRLIAATNRDLRAMCKRRDNPFRADLYDRLHRVPIETPPLRAHPEDIPALAIGLWRQITGDSSASLTEESVQILIRRQWRGNVRELENALEQLHIVFNSEETPERLRAVLEPEHEPGTRETDGRMTVPVDLLEVIEVIAKTSHETWRAKRKQEGWVWGKRRIETKTRKTNPDMLPFEELTDEQKSYARDEAKAVVRALLLEGFRIEK